MAVVSALKNRQFLPTSAKGEVGEDEGSVGPPDLGYDPGPGIYPDIVEIGE